MPLCTPVYFSSLTSRGDVKVRCSRTSARLVSVEDSMARNAISFTASSEVATFKPASFCCQTFLKEILLLSAFLIGRISVLLLFTLTLQSLVCLFLLQCAIVLFLLPFPSLSRLLYLTLQSFARLFKLTLCQLFLLLLSQYQRRKRIGITLYRIELLYPLLLYLYSFVQSSQFLKPPITSFAKCSSSSLEGVHCTPPASPSLYWTY